MPATKTRPGARPANGLDAGPGRDCVKSNEVLTLPEAAAFLRITEPDVIRTVEQQNLPGRLVGQEWRFLKSALEDWLRTPPLRPSKEAVLSRIGSWQNDPYLEKELEEIHKRRGRPTADGK